MARRTWMRCKCGYKIHVKSGLKMCYKCAQKQTK